MQATDPNGDALTYALDPDSLALGLTIDERGRIRWEPSLSDVGSYPVTVTVTDASGVSQDQAFTLTVAADLTDPVVDLDFVGELLLIGGQLSLPLGGSVGLSIAATDNQGISNLELTVDGEVVPLDVNSTSPYTPETTGLKTISLTATDTSGNTTTISRTLSVFDPTDADAPQIILDPLPEQITAPIDVTGTVTDANLVSYVIEVQPFGSGEPYREVFRGTDPVVDGVIGQLDTSVLPNDSYRVRVRATDASGKESRLEDQTSISGELKLGNFQLSFVDLEIPVSGIPITLVWTYDSLNANTTDELGYGWRLEFKDADVRVNLPRDPVFEELGYRTVGFRDETKVFVTLPGGTRETFFFDPTIIIWSLFLPGSQGNLFYPAFRPDKGVTSQLRVKDAVETAIGFSNNDATNAIFLNPDGEYVNVQGQRYNPANPYYGGIYILRTKEGIEYEIDGQTGDINAITDLNRNKLTFTDNGLFSSTGKNITFGRDSQGRITTVTDPMGNVIRYDYDANGDLVKVTDQEENETDFIVRIQVRGEGKREGI